MSLDIVLPMSLDRFVTYVPDRFRRYAGENREDRINDIP